MNDGGRDARSADGSGETQRLDKWLWFARIVKSRTLAATLVTSGKIRVNRERVSKPSQLVKTGDVIVSNASREVRIVRVRAPGARRGPATEAITLYEELTPSRLAPAEQTGDRPIPAQPERPPGTGRPTKRERRQIDLLKGRDRPGS